MKEDRETQIAVLQEVLRRVEEGLQQQFRQFYVLDKKTSVLREHILGMEKARKIQAIEYERRLLLLNHETSRMEHYVPREVYEGAMSELEKSIKELEKYRDQMVGRTGVIAAVISLILYAIINKWG